jgi:23S rRNA pseudouridine1911/1915/1917 synthase
MTDPYTSEEAALIDPAEFPQWILQEDDQLIVFNKPGWVVCHPSKNGPWSSLVGATREYAGLETLHLISRLDRETSGLVLIAKRKEVASLLQKAVQERWVDKLYLTIIENEMTERTEVSKPMENDDLSPVIVKQRVSAHGSGLKAQTSFIPLHHSNGYTLAVVKTHTGRKHQIRVHAQSIGYPLVGEKIYGHDETLYLEFIEKGWTPRMDEALKMKRQALHAWAMAVDLPQGRSCFFAPIPEDMLVFCQTTFGLSSDAIEALLDPLKQRLMRG